MSERTPSCPRCGYDQTGKALAIEASDSGSFPLQCVCSECGLEFWWGDVLNPSRLHIPGFIEHARRWTLLAAWRTLGLALFAPRFWQKVKLEHRPRVGRICLWAFLTAGLVVLAGSAAATVAVLLIPSVPLFPRSGGSPLLYMWLFGLLDYTYKPAASGFAMTLSFEVLPAGVAAALASSVVTPLVLMLLPDTRRRAKVLPAHVLRAATFGFAWLVIVLILRAALQVALAFEELRYMRAASRSFAAARIAQWPQTIGAVLHKGWWVWLWLLLGWLAIWWWWALQDGWRLQEHRRVWWAVMIPSWLAAAIAVCYSKDGLHLFM